MGELAFGTERINGRRGHTQAPRRFSNGYQLHRHSPGCRTRYAAVLDGRVNNPSRLVVALLAARLSSLRHSLWPSAPACASVDGSTQSRTDLYHLAVLHSE